MKNKKFIIWVLILLVYILVPNIYLAFHGADFIGASIFKRISFFILSFILISAPLLLFRPKIYLTIAILFLVFAPFEITTIYLYKASLNSGIIFSILNTTPREGIELVRGLLPLVLICFIYLTVYVFLLIKKIPYSFRFEKKIKLIGLVIFLLSLSILWIRDIRISSNIHTTWKTSYLLDEGTSDFVHKFGKIFPYSAISESEKYIENYFAIKKYRNEIKNFNFYSAKEDQLSSKEKYILVIGETSRSQSWSLYGYKRNTNPELGNLKNLITFSDFASNANLTSISIPLLLSRATPDQFDISYKEKNIVSAFKEAGFNTYWISNQGIFSDKLSRLTTDVDVVYDLNSQVNFSGNYDENILPYLDSVLMHPDKKQFIIINLMGSHFRYNYRYPEKYNIFKPGLDGAFDYMVINVKNRDKLVNIYDNSILYEDFVLAEIIKKINLTESVNFLTFLSDHGENLFDNKMNFFGHASENPTKYEILIPCFVWFSSKYVAAYPKKVDFLIQNKNKRLCSTNIFYSLLDAANIRYQNFEETKSFMNQNFIENDVRKVLLPSFKVVVFDKK